eukprot:594755-Rhodomonas_salina.3
MSPGCQRRYRLVVLSEGAEIPAAILSWARCKARCYASTPAVREGEGEAAREQRDREAERQRGRVFKLRVPMFAPLLLAFAVCHRGLLHRILQCPKPSRSIPSRTLPATQDKLGDSDSVTVEGAGETVWKIYAGSLVGGAALGDDDTVYIGSEDRQVTAAPRLPVTRGVPIWTCLVPFRTSGRDCPTWDVGPAVFVVP